MKKIVVYGVRGVMEYHAMLTTCGSHLKVSFTNGSATAFGHRPATFKTASAEIQFLIEESVEFKKGMIHIEQTIEMEDDEAKADATATAKMAAAATAEPTVEATAGMRQMQFSCNDEAKDYLEKEFGASKGGLKTRAQIEAAGRSYGIEIVWG